MQEKSNNFLCRLSQYSLIQLIVCVLRFLLIRVHVAEYISATFYSMYTMHTVHVSVDFLCNRFNLRIRAASTAVSFNLTHVYHTVRGDQRESSLKSHGKSVCGNWSDERAFGLFGAACVPRTLIR